MTLHTTKAIEFAYPSSINANKLGFAKTGCWHVSLTCIDIEESQQCRTVLPHDAEGFARADDPDLIAVFQEYEGWVDQSFINYGNRDALIALQKAEDELEQAIWYAGG